MLLAKEATTEQSKQIFLNLAQSWTKLAAELEDGEALLSTLNEIELKDAPKPAKGDQEAMITEGGVGDPKTGFSDDRRTPSV
jgi:hypothetical protein